MAPPHWQNTRQPTMKDQEHTTAPETCSEAHRQEHYDKYGPLLSALFEGSPSGASGFVTSTPKQTRAAPGNSDSARTVNDAGDNASPCTKEKRRYGKEWSLAAPRNRRNTSLGGVSLKASPSPSSSTHSLYINTGLGQWFSKDSPSQSSSLDSLASYYYATSAATPDKHHIVKNVKLLNPTISDVHFPGSGFSKSTPNGAPLASSISITTSDPDLRTHNDHSTSTNLNSALVWERPETRLGGPSGHNRSHSLASPPSGALSRRQTSRRHAIYCGTGVPGIPIRYDDPEETRVNSSRATIGSFDSNKAVCAVSEDSFSFSPKKDQDSLVAGYAPVSPVKPLPNTPEHVLRFFDIAAGNSDTRYYDTSRTAVTSRSFDEDIGVLSPLKEDSIVLPLKIQTTTKRTDVGGVKRVATLEAISGATDPDTPEHLPLMNELLDLVEEATKSWQLLWL